LLIIFRGLWLLTVFVASPVFAMDDNGKPITIAVSSNFLPTMKQIVQLYEKTQHGQVALSAGSTGKHFAQISRGAPYDLFFAADKARPLALEQNGIAVAGSRFSYAIGSLVLWGEGLPSELLEKTGTGDTQALSISLATLTPKVLALPNAAIAPYGFAAQEVLDQIFSWGHWRDVKVVRGENVSQTLQFVRSGSADLGFVALSQIKHLLQTSTEERVGGYIVLPKKLYSPIVQQAVVIRASDKVSRFLDFFNSAKVQQMITHSGYEVPTHD